MRKDGAGGPALVKDECKNLLTLIGLNLPPSQNLSESIETKESA